MAERLFPPILEVEMKNIADAYFAISKSHNFISELRSIRKHYRAGPHRSIYCNRLSTNTEPEYTSNVRT